MTEHLQPKITPGALLTPDKILIVTGAPDKKTLISRLVEKACQDLPQVNAADVAALVLKREEGVGTALETGLAIPHARLEELDRFCAAMAVLPVPVTDEKNPQTPVRVMFLFLSPANPSFFKQHLQLLSSLAETFPPEAVEEISRLQDPALILSRLRGPNMVK